MSLLSICQNAANDVGVIAPLSIINNSDPGAIRLLQFARRTARSLQKRAHWVALVTEHVFIANGTSVYPLPTDFDHPIVNTFWDRTRFWRMRGAMSPQQWQLYKSSIIGKATIERRWRIRVTSGADAGAAPVFELDPPIGSTDLSSNFVFEYVSKNWCRSASTFALEAPTVFAGGVNYIVGDTVTLSGGTFTTPATILVDGLSTGGVVTGVQVTTPGSYSVLPSSPATATGGSGSGLSLTVSSATMPGLTQPDWVADSDTAILDEDLIELGVIWRLQQRLGLAYLEEKEEYEREVDKAVARDGGSAILNLSPDAHLVLVGPYNVQEGNFPGPV